LRGAKVLAKRNSFQAVTKVMIAAETIPGVASGNITILKVCSGVAPSVVAASLSSAGIAEKNVRRMNIASGRENEM